MSLVANLLSQVLLSKSISDWPRRGQHHHHPSHPTPKRSSRLSFWSSSFRNISLIQLSFFLSSLFRSPPFFLHACSFFLFVSMINGFFVISFQWGLQIGSSLVCEPYSFSFSRFDMLKCRLAGASRSDVSLWTAFLAFSFLLVGIPAFRR